MGEFATLARAELDEVTVIIGDPYGFKGTVWNVGEYAIVRIEVNNTSTVTLRDVVVSADVWGGDAAITPVYWGGIPLFDGDQWWDEIEPGAERSYLVLMTGTGAGFAHMAVSLSAEIVPYAYDHHVTHNNMYVTAS